MLVLALVSISSGSYSAYAIPLSSTSPTSSDQLTREFTYDARDGAPQIAERIEEGDRVYQLISVSTPRAASDYIHEKAYTWLCMMPISAEVYAAGDAAVYAQFAPTAPIAEDGFAGDIPLVEVSTEPIYRTLEQQIERSVEYSGLTNEDARQLPERAEFETANDTAPGATTFQALERLGVSWQTTAFDEDGRPCEFTATVVYRGIERERVIDYYEVTALYRGTVAADAQMVTVVATYGLAVSPLPIVPVSGGTIEEGPVPLAAPHAFPLAATIAAVVISLLALLLLLLLYFFLYLNARLVRTDERGRRSVLVRRHLRVLEGQAVFTIPSTIAIHCEGSSTRIVLNRSLASREGMLVVNWGDRQLLRSALRESYDFDAELLVVLSEGIAGQSALDDEFEGSSDGLNAGEDVVVVTNREASYA
jgi:hypothetical protein